MPLQLPATETQLLPDIDNITSNPDPASTGWWKFNQNLEDSIGSNDFAEDGDLQDNYESYERFSVLNSRSLTKYGLLAEESKTFSTTLSGSFETSTDVYKMNLGFWWNSPTTVGYTRHATTKKLTSNIVPILSKATSSITAGTESVSVGEWIICEVAYSTSQNAIRVYVCDGGTGNPTYYFDSDPYDPGLITVYVDMISDSTSDNIFYIRIDINGEIGTQHAFDNSSGTLQVKNTVAPLRLFNTAVGPVDHKITQSGSFISELMMQTLGNTDSSKTLAMNRFGPEIALTNEGSFPNFSYLGIGYDQPTTISTTQVFSEGGNIIITRSDGELLRGSRPIWDNEFQYEDPDSLNNLTISETDNERIAEWTAAGLLLRGTTVRV